MKESSSHFNTAVRDYLFLLERDYPEKSTLKLVSDRYALSGEERSMLFRGVVPAALVRKRNKKSVQEPEPKSRFLVDGYNVIRTVGSYLNGNFVFVAMDGFLRDVSEIHKKAVRNEIVYRSADLVMETLSGYKPAMVQFFLDRPISKSGELASYINRRLPDFGLTGEAETVHSPDHHLKEAGAGIVCTSDSAVIDECRLPVFDLALWTLKTHFSTDIIRLSAVL